MANQSSGTGDRHDPDVANPIVSVSNLGKMKAVAKRGAEAWVIDA